jgi:hypothetical protein
MRIQVGGRGAKDHLHRAQWPRDQAAVGEWPDAEDRIVALVDEIDHSIRQCELNVDLRVSGEIVRQRPGKFVRAKGHQGVHPDPAAWSIECSPAAECGS